MKKNKKLALCISLISVIVSCLTIFATSLFFNEDNYDYLNGDANKVILFIGDGMGENHIQVAETKSDKKMFFTNFDKEGYVTTNSLTLGQPTDSAAAGTALATGEKVNNRELAYHNNKDIPSITEYAKSKGMGVGIITTDYQTGATPSAFTSHVKDRDDERDILDDQLNADIDLFFSRKNKTISSYKEAFVEKGYSFIESTDEMNQTSNKVMGSFDEISYKGSLNGDDDISLTEVVKYAIEYFESNYPNGYFMMVEGAHIDKRSHDNNVDSMINHLIEFDNAIKEAYLALGEQSDVSLIVTADHETGDLDKAESKQDINDELYNSTNHTSKDVKYFIHQNNDDIYQIDKKIDNTHIFRIVKALLS